MTKSISSVINGGFINSFTGLSQGSNNPGAEIARALNGQGSDRVSIRQGLRLGAQAFGTAVQNLNSLVTFVNVAENTLSKLGKLTDRMIDLAERAAKGTTSTGDRRKIFTEYEELAKEFSEVMNKAKLGDKELLEQGDIEELFVTLGLDRGTSKTVAAMFSQFKVFGTDKKLLDPEQGNTTALKIPASAFVGNKKQIEIGSFTQTQLTNTAPNNAMFMGNGVVELDGTQLNFDDGVTPWSLSNVDKFLGVDATSNYAIVQSTADHLGTNASNFNQLFLVDNSGTVISQLTNSVFSNDNYISADYNAAQSTWAFSVQRGGGFAPSRVFTGSTTDLGDATQHTYQQVQVHPTTVFDNVKISSDGSHLAYKATAADSTFRTAMYDTATLTLNSTLYNLTNRYTEFGFTDTNQLAMAWQLGSRYNIITYDYNNNSELISGNLDGLTNFTTIEKGLTNNNLYYVAFNDDSQSAVKLYRESEGLVTLHSIGSGSVQNLQLRADISGNESVKLGLFGTLAGDSDDELYQLVSTGTQTITQSTRLAPATSALGDILNSADKLLRRPDSFRLLHDLKGLREQIDTNLDALTGARKLVESNIELVRTTGLALLELSDQIDTSAEADEVARLLRNEIRRAPSKALAQAENLQAIAVAALTADSSSSDTLDA